MMETLLELLKDLRPDVDFENEEHLIDDGILDSLSILSLVGDLEDEFDVTISAVEVKPVNFNSVSAIMAMIERLQG